MKPIVITAHYDDMEISAGGTATRYSAQSIVVSPRIEGAKRSEWVKASRALALPVIRHITEAKPQREIVDSISTIGYDTVIASNPWDSHPDHKRAASIGQQVARKQGMNLLYMDHVIPGGYDGSAPKPNFFVAITGAKYDALKCYESQIEKYGPEWLQAVEARDRMYGWQHNTRWAEGFIVADWTI